MRIPYGKVNKALSYAFGKGQVELREDKTDEWEYVLWFLEDNPSDITIQKAEEIVGDFVKSEWFEDKAFHSEN